MSGLIESATAILSVSERRLEVAAHNVANISTPGFKRQRGFARLLPAATVQNVAHAELSIRRDFAQDALSATSNPLDLAISDAGAPATGKNQDVAHIDALADGGTNDLSNIRPMTGAAHRQ